MLYSVEPVTEASQQEMINFLKKHENTSLFLLGNFENYGSKLDESPYSGNYKLVRSCGEVVAVFCLIRRGNLLIETVVKEPIYDLIIEACQSEPISLKGVVGDWNFCGSFWDYLKDKKLIVEEAFTSKEVLYSIDLSNLDFAPQSNVRLLTDADYPQWRNLRLDYLAGEGLPNDFIRDKELLDLFHEKTKKKITWGLFQDEALVSVADLNAKALDLGQVGGVYTVPEFRQKGYSKSVMQQLLFDAKQLHKIRKLIIFTGEKNFPAQKLYTSLGVSPVGSFALLFGK